MAIVEAINIPIGVTGQETVQQAANSYEDLGDAVAKTQLEAERLAQQFGINDAKTQEAIKVAGKYKQQMEQLDFAIDAARGGTDQIFRATQGVVAGFEIAAGAAGLFGSESEELEKVLIKVQSAMALSQGLKDFQEFLPAITATATAIRTKLITAFSSLKAAIASTGIGLLIVSIGVLIQQTDEYNDEIDETIDRELELARIRDKEGVESINRSINATQKALEFKLLSAQKEGKSQQELRDIELKTLRDRRNSLREFYANEKTTQAERATALEEYNKISDIVTRKEIENQIAIKNANKEAAEQAKITAKERQKTEQKRLDDEFEAWQNQELANYEYRQELAAEQEKQRQQDLDDEKEMFNAELEYEVELAEMKLANAEYVKNRKKQIDEEALKDAKDLAEKQSQIQEDSIKALTDLISSSNSFLSNQNNKLNEEFESRINQLKELGHSQEEIANMRDAELQNIDARAKKNFEIAKKLQYAQTLISTIEGTQNAFTTAQKSPLTALFPAYPYIQAATAGAFGIAQLQQISQSSYDSKLKPSVSTASASASVPRFNAPTTRLPQTDEFTQVRRVYVTERDITNVQDKVKVTESLSQF
jgi:hypothetical protein